MWRVLVFLGLLCLAAYGAVWLANNPETIAVTWAGKEYSTSLAVGVVGLIAVALLISFLLGAVRYVVMLPSAIRRSSRGRKQRKGQTALTRGIVAVGAGDVAAARRYAGEAERLLGHAPLALLLKAQAAQAAGNRDAAEAAFRDMADKPDTRVLGLRGLYLEARRRGDAAAARDYAEEAAKAAPAVQWANDAVLEGLSAEGDWAGAIRLVERRTSLGLVDRTASRRLRAVLLTADALGREEREPAAALALAEQAVKLAPGLVPAAALTGRLLSAQGDLKRGAKVIETAWSENPHPELAGAYLNLRSGDSATDRLRRAETLARLSSWSDEARFAIARAAIEMRDFVRAREAVQPLLDAGGRPTTRLCMAMAEIEGRSGNAGGAREWLARAPRAARDKAWIADGIVSDRWAPVSPATGRIDAFVWETPPEAPDAAAGRHAITFEPGEPEEADDDLPVFLNRGLAPPVAEEPPAVAPPRPTVDAPAVPPAPVAPPAPPKVEPVAAVAAARAPPATIVGTDVPAQPATVPDTRIAPAAPTAAPPSQPAAVPAPLVAEPVASAPPKRMGPKPAEPAPSLAEPVAAASQKRMSPKPAEPAPIVSEPVASAPPKRMGESVPEAARKMPVEPGPVVFPVRHAPDDPGPEVEEDRRQRFRLRV